MSGTYCGAASVDDDHRRVSEATHSRGKRQYASISARIIEKYKATGEVVSKAASPNVKLQASITALCTSPFGLIW